MQKDRKPVIMAETTRIMLWGFRVTLKDCRDGELSESYAIETGNEEYDIDAATEMIKKKYARLGYNVTECEYDDTRVYVFNALEEFKKAKLAGKCEGCEFHICKDSSVGEEDGCQIAEDESDEDRETAAEYYKNNGEGCEFCERITPAKKEPEDKPDYLAEIMATLAELEEGAK